MRRSAGYNRFGVLMGTSWPASCPRSHRLQGDFSPMITLILLQRAFCATAIELSRRNVFILVEIRRTLETGDKQLGEEAVAFYFSHLLPFTPGREHLAHSSCGLLHTCIGVRCPTTQTQQQARKARVHRKEHVLGAQAVGELLEPIYRDGRGVVVMHLPFDRDDVGLIEAIRNSVLMTMYGKEDKTT